MVLEVPAPALCLPVVLRSHVGAEKTLDKAKELAAEALEASAQDLQYAGGEFLVAGTDLKISLAALAAKQPSKRIELQSTTTANGPTWPNGCHVCAGRT
jgi:carbon-monoxide dehydrogenase large subunit